MQDQYAGDVGDFGKFSLLQMLCGQKKSLGVVWYRYPDEKDLGDGRHTGYTEEEKQPLYTACDRGLVRRMKEVHPENRRTIRELEKALKGYLPKRTIYFDETLLDRGLLEKRGIWGQAKKKIQQRLEERDRWLRAALSAVRGCDVVFLDPDNGLEIKSCSKKHQVKAGKYVFYDEVEAFAEMHDLVVVYHHLSRQGSHKEQVDMREKALRKRLKGYEVHSLMFRRYSPRAYFLIAQEPVIVDVKKRVDAYLDGPCGFMWK
jgi:hypothetical protein